MRLARGRYVTATSADILLARKALDRAEAQRDLAAAQLRRLRANC